MQSKRTIYFLLVAVAAFAPWVVSAQSSSLNTFSPYTFYGLGDLSTQGTALVRSMGGAGIGYRSSVSVNYLNPAAYSAVNQRSFLFNVGMEGSNYYDRTASTKTSFNTFNIRDIALQFPIIRNLGFGFSITPYSNVGYRVQAADTTTLINSAIGRVNYIYTGSGGVTQAKAGVGWQPFKGLSIGAELVYYFGSIERTYNTTFTVITGSGAYNAVTANQTESVSKIFANFGVQYTPIQTPNTILTLGAVYQMGGKLNSEIERYIPSGNLASDVVLRDTLGSNFSLPNTFGAGIYLHRAKWSIGADYVYSAWGSVNGSDATPDVTFRNTSTIKIGGQFTPRPGDVRNFFNRCSYRMGLRYGNHYMDMRGQSIDDKAITIGAGMPVKLMGLNYINLGAELGQRGSTRNGLIKETYFKFSIGISLFGEDYWFMKYKYD